MLATRPTFKNRAFTELEFPQFVVDRQESDRFVARVLASVVDELAKRQGIWETSSNVSPSCLTLVHAEEMLGGADEQVTVERHGRRKDLLSPWHSRPAVRIFRRREP